MEYRIAATKMAALMLNIIVYDRSTTRVNIYEPKSNTQIKRKFKLAALKKKIIQFHHNKFIPKAIPVGNVIK